MRESQVLVRACGEDEEVEDREDFASPGLCNSLGIEGGGIIEGWEMGTE